MLVSNNKFSDFDEYQRVTKKTANYPTIGKRYVFPALGLAGEVGEVSEKVKKLFRDKGGKLSKVDKLEIAKELGDVLWYLTQLCSDMGLKFSDVAKMNIEKIMYRTKENKIHGSGDSR